MASVNCAPKAFAIHPAYQPELGTNRTDTQVQALAVAELERSLRIRLSEAGCNPDVGGSRRGRRSPLGGSVRAGALAKRNTPLWPTTRRETDQSFIGASATSIGKRRRLRDQSLKLPIRSDEHIQKTADALTPAALRFFNPADYMPQLVVSYKNS